MLLTSNVLLDRFMTECVGVTDHACFECLVHEALLTQARGIQYLTQLISILLNISTAYSHIFCTPIVKETVT